ncbi:MAG: DNA-binding response regulator, partial [Candidatus Electrothrix sp. EH2]|nr:DNA-binding response regulator [Candidatus Electrothrix sp. EH2]
ESSDLSDSTYGNLTAREQEIFRLLAQGTSVADIADKLCISAKAF